MACRPNKKLCYVCEKWFLGIEGKHCHKCLEFKCPHCGSCGCSLTEGEYRVMKAMTKTYEQWIEDYEAIGFYSKKKHNIILFNEMDK